MAVWGPDDGSVGFVLIQNGFITKFHSPRVFEEALDGFRRDGYRVVGLDAADWDDEPTLHYDFSSSLGFPGYYGRTLDALNDCMRDVAEQAVGWREDDTGLIIAIDHVDRFVARAPLTASIVLDIVADAARLGALLGNRILCLVRTDDPRLVLGARGGAEPEWNPREWPTAMRSEG